MHLSSYARQVWSLERSPVCKNEEIRDQSMGFIAKFLFLGTGELFCDLLHNWDLRSDTRANFDGHKT